MNPTKPLSKGHRYFSTPRGALTSARLQLAGGPANLSLVPSPPESPALFEALFEGTPPEVQLADADVRVDYRRRHRLFDRPGDAEMALHPAVSWTVTFRGGVSQTRADL